MGMQRLRQISGPLRTQFFALLAMLVLVGAVMQARAATEAAARADFASPFSLCLQGGSGGENQGHDHDCDACRVFPASVPPGALIPSSMLDGNGWQWLGAFADDQPVSACIILPGSRGPPDCA